MTNIILVTIDCFRYDACGFNGCARPTTPTLDALASESLIFDRAYATGPYTTESVPGIVAGTFSYNGVYFGDSPAWKAIPNGAETLATKASEAGYETVATLTNPHLTKERNFDRGFDSFRNLRTQGDNDESKSTEDEEDSGLNLSKFMYDIRGRMRNHGSVVNPFTLPFVAYRHYQKLGEWPTVSGETVIGEFIDDLSRADEAFFGWTHLMDLHAPIHPERANQGGISNLSSTSHFLADAARASRNYTSKYERLYESTVRYTDRQLERLIEVLKSRDLWEDTVLIVTGDHGEVLYDRNSIYGHPRHHMYDELLRVPLLVRTPDSSRGRVSRPFSLADISTLFDGILSSDGSEEMFQRLLVGDMNDTSPIISDTLDEGGHTVCIRDEWTKVVGHSAGSGGVSGEYSYLDRPIQFSYWADRGERIEQPVSETELLSKIENLFTDSESLSAVGDGFSQKAEQRLHDLGYKM